MFYRQLIKIQIEQSKKFNLINTIYYIYIYMYQYFKESFKLEVSVILLAKASNQEIKKELEISLSTLQPKSPRLTVVKDFHIVGKDCINGLQEITTFLLNSQKDLNPSQPFLKHQLMTEDGEFIKKNIKNISDMLSKSNKERVEQTEDWKTTIQAEISKLSGNDDYKSQRLLVRSLIEQSEKQIDGYINNILILAQSQIEKRNPFLSAAAILNMDNIAVSHELNMRASRIVFINFSGIDTLDDYKLWKSCVVSQGSMPSTLISFIQYKVLQSLMEPNKTGEHVPLYNEGNVIFIPLPDNNFNERLKLQFLYKHILLPILQSNKASTILLSLNIHSFEFEHQELQNIINKLRLFTNNKLIIHLDVINKPSQDGTKPIQAMQQENLINPNFRKTLKLLNTLYKGFQGVKIKNNIQIKHSDGILKWLEVMANMLQDRGEQIMSNSFRKQLGASRIFELEVISRLDCHNQQDGLYSNKGDELRLQAAEDRFRYFYANSSKKISYFITCGSANERPNTFMEIEEANESLATEKLTFIKVTEDGKSDESVLSEQSINSIIIYMGDYLAITYPTYFDKTTKRYEVQNVINVYLLNEDKSKKVLTYKKGEAIRDLFPLDQGEHQELIKRRKNPGVMRVNIFNPQLKDSFMLIGGESQETETQDIQHYFFNLIEVVLLDLESQTYSPYKADKSIFLKFSHFRPYPHMLVLQGGLVNIIIPFNNSKCELEPYNSSYLETAQLIKYDNCKLIVENLRIQNAGDFKIQDYICNQEDIEFQIKQDNYITYIWNVHYCITRIIYDLIKPKALEEPHNQDVQQSTAIERLKKDRAIDDKNLYKLRLKWEIRYIQGENKLDIQGTVTQLSSPQKLDVKSNLEALESLVKNLKDNQHPQKQ